MFLAVDSFLVKKNKQKVYQPVPNVTAILGNENEPCERSVYNVIKLLSVYERYRDR
ncbi:hypothetical protein J6590_025582 [Homalodisca vitripennis]|nr:hypothetical protein J6590_025582 [Homalodisca vitripennis]